MFELIVFILALGSDWFIKKWSMDVLANLPGQTMDIIPEVFWLQYAQNPGYGIGFLRSRSWFNTALKILMLIIIIYLIVKYRKQLAPVTRFGMMLYAAGMLGNQLNYWILDFVPDMFMIGIWKEGVFNLADVYLMIALIIISIRLIFFEGQTFMQAFIDSFGKDKKSSSESESDDSELFETDNGVNIDSDKRNTLEVNTLPSDDEKKE